MLLSRNERTIAMWCLQSELNQTWAQSDHLQVIDHFLNKVHLLLYTALCVGFSTLHWASYEAHFPIRVNRGRNQQYTGSILGVSKHNAMLPMLPRASRREGGDILEYLPSRLRTPSPI
ncbi:hypothetical protein CC2G_012219 [Coprinopsis cinerea AmutBmut pab1-1]|nr:hypothetical protein CC2G_012219 [Coprinopsis cinerea AmutBmut pab1-1]